MFEALRWRLTAWYVLAFAAVFAAVAAVVLAWANHRISGEVDRAVRNVSDAARQAVVANGSPERSNGAVIDILESETLSGSADVFVLLLGPDGGIAENPGEIPTKGLPDPGSVSAANRTGEDWREISIDGQPIQLRTAAVYDSAGTLLGYVQAGKSVEERNTSLRTLVLVMVGGGIAGLVLATAGGLLVAGIAIRPVRRSFDRQREFVADASHELRTPLAVIRTNSETMAAAKQHDEAVDDIVTEASYMTRLLDDLLKLAGSDTEGVALRMTRMDLAEAARSAVHVAEQLGTARGVDVTADIRGPLWIDGDIERTREVLLILLDNAVKYTPRGGSATLTTALEGGDAVVTVADTGIGVPAEHVNRIFDRFYRVDKARSRALGGSGLGLSIAREIIDAHHGRIDIESTPDKGTTVTVRLRAVA